MSVDEKDLFLLSALELRRLHARRASFQLREAASRLSRPHCRASTPISAPSSPLTRITTLAAAEPCQRRIEARRYASSRRHSLCPQGSHRHGGHSHHLRLEAARAATYPCDDAAVARRLREAGGVLLGKTNTPEFGNRATTAFGLFEATRNPWDLTKTAGGSSGGSAAAVAACLAPIRRRLRRRGLHPNSIELLRRGRDQTVPRTCLERSEFKSARRPHHAWADRPQRCGRRANARCHGGLRARRPIHRTRAVALLPRLRLARAEGASDRHDRDERQVDRPTGRGDGRTDCDPSRRASVTAWCRPMST